MKLMATRIAAMNAMYNLPVLTSPGIPDHLMTGKALAGRIEDFQITLNEEIDEGDELVALLSPLNESVLSDVSAKLDVLTHMADWYCDIIVYCMSEAAKFGIPVEEVLHIIMDSNESKLGVDGKPIHNEQGKFMKGPNYWKPEGKIRDLLLTRMREQQQLVAAAQWPLIESDVDPENPDGAAPPLDLVTKTTHRQHLADLLEAERISGQLDEATVKAIVEELRK